MEAKPQHPAIAMTIAGSDSSGGAGIQADLKTFTALGVYGASVITALTAQNTRGVTAVELASPAFVAAQIKAVLDDLDVAAIKTGMLAASALVESIAAELSNYPLIPLIVDPVMVATSGDRLIDDDAVDAVKRLIFPRALLITPNLPEAARLLDSAIATTESEAGKQLEGLARLGAKAVLLKGGHGSGGEAVDLLWHAGRITRLASSRIDTKNTHGTGCTLSAAIAALIASGASTEAAVTRGKAYVHAAISSARDLRIGKGHGPVDHLYAIRRTSPAV
ncbi:MAG TPA: bifunctional hydroxymethylpyrimidine kinase/phosphomethylpyrimidine kinase [Hyphomicrobiaceae bacterium]|nr:bifunctional hydroxymethylpyrimidine kinase/phosphomethylpyrimidine kinase [Hyphomicrobiaceae bacterium]